MEELYRSSGRFREFFSDLLDTKIPTEIYSTDYDNPSWAFKQADRNGYIRALKEVKHLLDYKETT